MGEPSPTLPADRKLHCVHRGIVSVLVAVASVLMLLWLVDVWATGEAPTDDVTWYVSSGIRLVSFLALTLLAFLATYKAQPARSGGDELAHPSPSSLRLRVVAAACAALFFGDQAASSFAAQEGSWIAVVGTVLLGLLTLSAVISVATGRAALRLWSEAGPGAQMPVWREPTEAEVNRRLPSVGAQTVWLGVFLVAWLLAHDLPPIVPLASLGDGVTMTLILEGLNLTTMAVAHYAKRELTLCGLPYERRARVLDIVMAVLGTMMSTEVGIRVVLAFDDLPTVGFWLGSGICLLGLVAGTLRLLKSVQSPEAPAD